MECGEEGGHAAGRCAGSECLGLPWHTPDTRIGRRDSYNFVAAHLVGTQ